MGVDKKRSETDDRGEMLRIFRSPKADFERDPELADQVYTEEVLQQLADAGFNAIWVRIIYHKLLTNPAYPSFGAEADEAIARLNRVAERGAKCGVKLVVYCQEPFGLGVDDPFWEKHPDMAGVPWWAYNIGTEENPFYMRGMCTSSEATRQFLATSSEQLLRRVPGVAGIITITASEFATHCYSHYPTSLPAPPDRPPLACPRCRERPAIDVVAEVLNCMREGMNRADPSVPLIAWNWSWYFHEPDPQPGIISRLNPGIDILADFERGDVKVDPTGREVEINEYSLSYVGPSERFMRTRAVALKHGCRVYAKLQLSTTHELATVSNIPLIGNIHDKAKEIGKLDLAGFMGCWNFGNELTLNTEAFNFCLSSKCPKDRTEALTEVAKSAFPGCDVSAVLEAWEQFSQAFDYYPFSIPFLYYSPINYSLALPMRSGGTGERKMGRAWLMDPRDDSDDPSQSYGPFTPEEIADRFGTMVKMWKEGLQIYERGLESASGCVDRELAAARAVYFSLRSVENFYRLHLLKRDWQEEMLPQFRQTIEAEIQVIEEALPVYEGDLRQGFHSEAHDYMVTPELMRRKLDLLRGS